MELTDSVEMTQLLLLDQSRFHLTMDLQNEEQRGDWGVSNVRGQRPTVNSGNVHLSDGPSRVEEDFALRALEGDMHRFGRVTPWPST